MEKLHSRLTEYSIHTAPQGAGPQPPRRQPHEVQHLVGQQAAQLEKVLILEVASQDQLLAQHQSHCWAFFLH